MTREVLIATIYHAATEMTEASQNGNPAQHMQISKGYLKQKADLFLKAAEALEETTLDNKHPVM